MIEEIKKEILENQFTPNNITNTRMTVIFTNDILNILSNYNNQPNYKSAFDEIFEKSHYKNITMEDMIDFSKKYNLGGE